MANAVTLNCLISEWDVPQSLEKLVESQVRKRSRTVVQCGVSRGDSSCCITGRRDHLSRTTLWGPHFEENIPYSQQLQGRQMGKHPVLDFQKGSID